MGRIAPSIHNVTVACSHSVQMSKSRRTLIDPNRPASPDSAEGSESDKSPRLEASRGRRRDGIQDEVDAQVELEMNSPRADH